MKIIKYDDAFKCFNSDKCQNVEYSFGDSDIDLGLAIISGRYPEEGFCVNLECKELIYVIDGAGKLYFDDSFVAFSKGDSILIDKNEKYYWDTDYCKVSMVCTPAWSRDQYRNIKD